MLIDNSDIFDKWQGILKEEVNGTVILPPLVFPAKGHKSTLAEP
jgi:hypothetical protein